MSGAVEVIAKDKDVPSAVAEDRTETGAASRIRFWDGSMARDAERRIKLQSPVRKAVSPWWCAAVLRLFEDAPDELIVGKDGYLFLRDRAVLPEATLRDEPVRVANYLYALRRRMTTMGMRLISLPIPRKAAVLVDKLPNGLDPAPEFDRALLEELRARGNEFVDLFAAWEGIDPTDVYEPYDSHWTTHAQWKAAEEILRKFPELKRREHSYPVREIESPPSMDLLAFAGVSAFHPARQLMHQDPMVAVEVDDDATMELITGLRYQGEILLSGTSFVGMGSLQSMLSVLLGANLEGRGINGGVLTHSLGIAIKWRELGGELPSVIIDEFPIHQLNFFPGKSGKQVRINGGVFQLNAVEDVVPLATFPARASRTDKTRSASIQAHSLVSSGDGALSLEIIYTGAQSQVWAVRTGETRFDIRMDAGGSRAVVPIIEGPEWFGSARVWCKEAAVGDGSVSVSVVVEGALDSTGAISLHKSGSDRIHRSEELHPIGAEDTLLFSWPAPCDQLRIELVGRDAAGQPVRDEYVFEGPKGTEAAISPRRLGGGALESVTVEGPEGSVLLRRVRR